MDYSFKCRYYVLVSSFLLLSMLSTQCLAESSELPEPVPPVYTKIKNLFITTDLVKDGKPNAVIIAPASGLYAESAERIQRAFIELTGVMLPIAAENAPEAALPVKGNLIVIGNRSTNRTVEKLYNRFYTLLNLRYPGPEGYVVRTLHNPFGNGHNVVFIGGSDHVGVKAAADVFIKNLGQSESKRGSITIGQLAEIKLGKGIVLPGNVREYEIWEASRGFGSTGYFGWTSLSKHMAMYYMTGSELNAREFIRLAFPDEQALRKLSEIDGERVKNKNEPLSGFGHYCAHTAILFWDLIEESPVFTDEERLLVTNTFSKQLNHREVEGIYVQTTPRTSIGSRHDQWTAISLYCLGRYFQKDYSNPIWYYCILGAKMQFASLDKNAWAIKGHDDLYWHNTFITPIFTWLLLTDVRTIQAGAGGYSLR